MQSQQVILAVDDDTINIEVLTELLEDDYRLITARSGEEALEVAAESNPDLILLDVMMPPGINGYETCRRLRADPKLNHTNVVLVSAKAAPAERLAGYEAGADDYVTKPFDTNELLAKVKVFLRLKPLEHCPLQNCPLLQASGEKASQKSRR